MSLDKELFKKGDESVTLSDVFAGIHKNSTKKDKQIQRMILGLEPLIVNLSDATIVVPLVKEYLEIAVKNDEQLIKLAAIAQRLLAVEQKSTEGGLGLELTEEEITDLKKSIDEAADGDLELTKKISQTADKVTGEVK